MPRISFAIIASLILIAISYFTSKIYAIGMRLEGVGTRLAFFVFLLIPLLFVTSIILAQSGKISATLYREIHILSGIAWYISLGAIVLSLCLLVALIARAPLPAGVAWGICFVSLILAATGFVQSRFITITNYTVTLPDAPLSWNDKTAVLVSDTHFGLINHKTFSDKVVDRIISLHPDFVLHAGDFYDGPTINTAPLTTSWKRLTAVTPVFYAPGNHEAYGPYEAFLTSIRDAGVTVLDDKKTLYDGIQIAGITYRPGSANTDAASAISALHIDPTIASILINHPPTSLVEAQIDGVDLMVSGHTHNGQFWPLTYLVRKIYGIYYYGHKTYKDMQTITSSGVGTWGPPFRLFNPPELVLITFKSGK